MGQTSGRNASLVNRHPPQDPRATCFVRAADPEASPEILRERVARRAAESRDASEAGLDVLEAQLGAVEPFTTGELAHVLSLTKGLDETLESLQALLISRRHAP